MDVASETKAGLAWTGAGKTVVQLIGFGVALALARLLTPADFGLVGMVVVVSGFLAVFSEIGLSAALIQREQIEERHRSSVFWANLALGTALGLALFAAAPALATFYRESRVTWMTRALALNFVLAPLGMVQSAVLTRAMRFDKLALAEIIASVGSSAVGLALALRGFGPWALVAMPLASTLGSTAALLLLSGWRPRLVLQRSALAELWGFSSHLFGYSVLEYWARQVDDLLIGRVLGARPLGLYSRAFSTMMMPVTEVGAVLSRVMFPAFSKLQRDPARIREQYLRVVAVIAFVTFPVLFALSVLSEPFIRVLYGPAWVPAKTVLSIYCIAGASHAVGSTVGWLYMALGRTDLLLRWGLFAGSLTIAGIVLGIWLGSIESVAACYAAVSVLVLSVPRFAWVGRLIGMKVSDVFRAVRGALGASLAVSLALLALGRLTAGFAPALDFALRGTLALVIYLVLARAFSVRGLAELRAAVRAKFDGAPAGS
ncbi:MAG: lipopolysaccharide biosynthesis protein [Polyangiaceae bacterium]